MASKHIVAFQVLKSELSYNACMYIQCKDQFLTNHHITDPQHPKQHKTQKDKAKMYGFNKSKICLILGAESLANLSEDNSSTNVKVGGNSGQE